MHFSNGNTSGWIIILFYIVLNKFKGRLLCKIPVEIHSVFLEIVNAKMCDFYVFTSYFLLF